MRPRFRHLAMFSGSLLALWACSSDDGRQLPEPGPDQTATIAVVDTSIPAENAADLGSAIDTVADASSAAPDEAIHEETGLDLTISAPWGEAGVIPADLTCDGTDQSPEIAFAGVPADTAELAVVFTDLDADNFVHWVAFGIPAGSPGLAAGDALEGIAQATNSFGNVGYGGPCPPDGQHAYLLELYALSGQLELPDGAPAADVIQAIQAAPLAVASVLGLYPGA